MTKEKLNYSRQEELFDPVTQKFKIIVLGAGSLGSFITLNLAKLGFNDISVYDYDYVEGANIPNQFFRMSDIGKPKVEALKEIIRAWGMNPEQILTRDALNDGATTHKSPEDFENHQLQILSNQLKQMIRQEATV